MTPRHLTHRTGKLLRSGCAQLLACLREMAWTRTRLHLPRNDSFPIRSSQNDGVSVRLADPEESIEPLAPRMPGEKIIHPAFTRETTFHTPPSYVVELRGGRFWGFRHGSVFTADGRMLPELSKDTWEPSLHPCYLRTHLPAPRILPGRTLSLVTPGATANYRHWLLDLLPRAGLAERAGYDLQSFDHILVKHRDLPYQLDSFHRLGIDPRKILRVDDTTHLVAETLIVPAIRHDPSQVNHRDLRYSRSLYLPEKTPAATTSRRLYISRRDTARRRLANETEILPLLRRHGFEEVLASTLTPAQQAQLFSEAAVVLAPHGAALASLIFAPGGCRVIELFAPAWIARDYWMLSAALGLDYTAIIGTGPRPPPDSPPDSPAQDITVDPALLELALGELTPVK